MKSDQRSLGIIHEATLPGAPARALPGQRSSKETKRGAQEKVKKLPPKRSSEDNKIPAYKNSISSPKEASGVEKQHLKHVYQRIEDAEEFISKMKVRSFEKKKMPKAQRKVLEIPKQDPPEPAYKPQMNSCNDITAAFQNRLSMQLDSLLETTKTLRSTRSGLDQGPSILKCDCKKFVVGKIQSNSNSSTQFFTDRMEYHVHHPSEGRIHMIMFYRDMVDIHVAQAKRTLEFKITQPLHLFSHDYDPLDPLHILSMEFGSQQGIQNFEQKVSCIMPRYSTPAATSS